MASVSISGSSRQALNIMTGDRKITVPVMGKNRGRDVRVTARSVHLLLALWAAGGFALDVHAARAAALGAVLGLDRGSISGDAPPNTEYAGKTGVIAGLQGEIGIGGDISLSVQPMYTRRITDVKAVDDMQTSGESRLQLSLDYIAIPLLLKFGAAGGRTYVASGVNVGYLTSARISGQGFDEDVKSFFSEMEVGAVLGFGVVIPVGRPRLTTELRYVQGLVNLAGDESASPIRNLPDRFHSNGWQLMAAILFPFGGR